MTPALINGFTRELKHKAQLLCQRVAMPGPSVGATFVRGGRFGFLPLAAFAFLAACADTGSVDPDSPWAPGVARDEQAVDGMLVGHRLMRAGEYELAIDAFERAAVTEGLSADVLLGIGSASLGLGRLHTAETHLRDALDQDERSPEIWNNLGVVLMELGETAEASQSFQRAYALDNGSSDSIRDNLRLALEKLENPGYTPEQEQNYKLVRRGSNDFLIRSIP